MIIKFKALTIILFGSIFLLLPSIVLAADFRKPEIKIFNITQLNEVNSFYAFNESFNGGMSIAVCNLDGIGSDEIVVGAGFGGSPQVRIFNSDGVPLFTPGFFAYDVNFRGGINIACGDLDGNGESEIVTVPKNSGGPHLKIFNRYGTPVFTTGFFVFDPKFKGGVNISIGDLDGGGLNEIIVAPAKDAEPRLKAYNRYGSELPIDLFPFHQEYAGGVSLTLGQLNETPEDELIVGVQSQDVALIKVINSKTKSIISEWKAFPETYKNGINLASGDIDNDGFEEIIVSANSGGGPHIKTFDINGNEKKLNFFAYENDFRGGVLTAVGDVNNDGLNEVITSPLKKIIQGEIDLIVVDLSEQRLYAYEDNSLLKTFLVSTGLPGMDTQPGNFSISQKIYSKLYSGPDYYLPNTLWNMRFDGSRLLHGAYWHNDFGRRKSHGCVNIAYNNAEWLYNSTKLGTKVIVKN